MLRHNGPAKPRRSSAARPPGMMYRSSLSFSSRMSSQSPELMTMPVAGTSASSESWEGRARRQRSTYFRLLGLACRLAGVGDAPDGSGGVVGDQQRAVLRNGNGRRPTPHLGALT